MLTVFYGHQDQESSFGVGTAYSGCRRRAAFFIGPERKIRLVMYRRLSVHRPPAGLIVHSGQDSKYRVTRFKNLVDRHGAWQRMSRRDNCYDNAQGELCWSRFKAELLDSGCSPSPADAKLEISHHIAYYNAECRRSALERSASDYYETQLQTTSQL